VIPDFLSPEIRQKMGVLQNYSEFCNSP